MKAKVDKTELCQHWRTEFESERNIEDKVIDERKPLLSESVKPLQLEEVATEQREFSVSSAGPNMLDVNTIKKLNAQFLAKFFNLWLFLGYIPQCFRESRTKLIPKKRDAKEPKDFRPKSVQSVLVRLFHKILARRLIGKLHLNQRQKGFCPLDGCAHNLYLLDSLICSARDQKRPIAVLLIDFKNAFGSVAHKAIFRACLRVGVPALLREYIRECYTNASTQLLGEIVGIRRG